MAYVYKTFSPTHHVILQTNINVRYDVDIKQTNQYRLRLHPGFTITVWSISEYQTLSITIGPDLVLRCRYSSTSKGQIIS